jgi:hypothetical protein
MTKTKNTKLHIIKVAPIIDAINLPIAIFREIDANNTIDHLLYVMGITYPLFYAWLIEQGAFKQGEEGYVGII